MWAKPMQAQEDYLLEKINTRLREGNCESAQKLYNSYTASSKRADADIERRIAECKRGESGKDGNITQSSVTFTVGGVDFTMVRVEGGTFVMGCTSEQGDECDYDESPAHSVTEDDFYMGETEVTVGLFRQFISQTGYKTDAEKYGWAWAWSNKSGSWKWDTLYNVSWMCDTKGGVRNITQDNYPVMYVSWNDATEFCEWLSRQTGRTFRLPTEAEWEYAARGGRKTKGYKYSGGDHIGEVAWYGNGNNAGGVTHAVKVKKANELGLYDMTGNVGEWCSDWKGYYSSDSQHNPVGPATGSNRVYRGGSWSRDARLCRVANRWGDPPSNRDNLLGFRVVLVP